MPEPKQKYKITFKCHDFECGQEFVKITTNPKMEDAKCPACKKRREQHRMYRVGDGAVSDEEAYRTLNPTPQIPPRLMEDGKPVPSISIGGSVQGKAIDSTAEIIMQDYKMTDLRDDARTGETAAPKLPPAMQQQVDTFFTPKKNPGIPFNAQQLGRAAMRGAYKNNSADIGAIHRNTPKPNIEIVNKGKQ